MCAPFPLATRPQPCHGTLMPTLVSWDAQTERELWTAEDFLDWLKPGVHADLIDGEKCVHSPVHLKHAKLLDFLNRLLGLYIDDHSLGKLYREVIAVRLSSRNVYLPDLAFFSNDQLASLRPTHATVAPRLVAEALSPWSAERDTGPKFAEYEQQGVEEYWILDPETLAHRFYAREGDLLVEFAAGEPVIRSRVIAGFFLRREWLDPERLPKISAAYDEVGRQ